MGNVSSWAIIILLTFLVSFSSGCKKENNLLPHSDYPIDGPYLFDHPDGWNLIYVDSANWVRQTIITDDYFYVVSSLFPALQFRVDVRYNIAISPYEYTTENKVLAVSDIEGNLPLFLEFLEANDVINDELDWVYGENHVVIIGDLFDRGVDVTALLWFVYRLEEQAEKQGGKVHFLLGNHDTMVLNGDHTYTRSKYINLAAKVGVPLEKLYGVNSILGRWIRTKNTIIKINGIVYNHAGISYEYTQRNFDINEVNQLVRNHLGMTETQICQNDERACFLYGKNGPLWYNGYFYIDGITQDQIEYILLHLDAIGIVIGHSKVEELQVMFDKAIIAIDTHTTQKNNLGEYSESYAEGLLISGGRYYRVNNFGIVGEL